jgi:hypothetical protein
MLLVDIMTNKAQNTLAETDDSWDSDTTDYIDLSDHWLAVESRDKEKSRIKRQMKARRELERLQDEKRLRKLVDSWSYDD